MKKLPVGIQTFEEIRTENYLYVDKTEHLYRIATAGKVYFLSRPRRFGKSLTLSTLDALFSGRKELFEGLYIYDQWGWNKKYPVIRIDWTLISHRTPEEIERNLFVRLKIMARNNNLTLLSERAGDCLGELIEELHRKTGEKVVMLIDEYDVPILDVMGKPSEEMKAMRESLHDIYKVMKGSDEHIKFIFLTGVSKFSGLSIFSALNNIEDITLSKEYASICGITQEELESNFSEHLLVAAKELSMTYEELLDDIRQWYNGYSWDGKTSVYNPFSTLRFCKSKEFQNYWFDTGTPTFLIELLKNRNNVESFLRPTQTQCSVFSSYDPEHLETLPLLFQTGYLTIKSITRENNKPIYQLEPPNFEVRDAFIDHLFKSYTELPMEEMTRLHNEMSRHIRNGDSEGLERNLKAMIARVPYQLHIEAEKYYHSLLLVWLHFLGFEPQGEILTNIGRMDAVWKLPDVTVVAEVKFSVDVNLDKLLDDASKQIHDRKYYEAYLTGTKKVILLSVAFSGKEIGCKMETVN
ncbi:MAG: ATP-binding protein [Planctomycetaceae bacterium]|jgi:predicted DNA-binding ribbon-helix-helix protein|nr:ATP-binding protein [Planctomycetaceae bacterium]